MHTILTVARSENDTNNRQYSLQVIFASKALRPLNLKSANRDKNNV